MLEVTQTPQAIFSNLAMYPVLTKKSPKTREVIADSLIKMFIEGPDVSFNGSPTVSPVTAAL